MKRSELRVARATNHREYKQVHSVLKILADFHHFAVFACVFFFSFLTHFSFATRSLISLGFILQPTKMNQFRIMIAILSKKAEALALFIRLCTAERENILLQIKSTSNFDIIGNESQ